MVSIMVASAAIGLALAAGVLRPGWTHAPGRVVRRAGWWGLCAAYIAAGALLGLSLDPVVRRELVAWTGGRTAGLEPLWTWVRGPSMPGALLFLLAIGAVVSVDSVAPGRLGRLDPRSGLASGGRLAT